MKAKLVENIDFERGQEPKEAMGIGRSEEIYGIEGIEAYTHFLFNADHDFIDQIWGDWNHLKKKLEGLIGEKNFMSAGDIAHFDRELDLGNRRKLYKYILENHKRKW
jgi:hypothetical protein